MVFRGGSGGGSGPAECPFAECHIIAAVEGVAGATARGGGGGWRSSPWTDGSGVPATVKEREGGGGVYRSGTTTVRYSSTVIIVIP